MPPTLNSPSTIGNRLLATLECRLLMMSAPRPILLRDERTVDLAVRIAWQRTVMPLNSGGNHVCRHAFLANLQNPLDIQFFVVRARRNDDDYLKIGRAT